MVTSGTPWVDLTAPSHGGASARPLMSEQFEKQSGSLFGSTWGRCGALARSVWGRVGVIWGQFEFGMVSMWGRSTITLGWMLRRLETHYRED